MILIDASARWSHVCLVSTRNVAFFRLLAQIIRLRAQFLDHPIKAIHLDNAGEFSSQAFIDYCMSIGIDVPYSIAHVHTQNGSAKFFAPSYSTWHGGQTRFGDVDLFYHIYIFEYCRNKCRIIISVKEGPPFCQLTLSFNMTCMPFQHYHLQNIIRVHFHK